MPVRRLSCLSLFTSVVVLMAACSTVEPMFERGAPRRAAPPAGPWVLTAFQDHDAQPTVTITLTVDDDQRLSGDAGCNQWFVTWALSEDTGKLGPVGATRRSCPPEIMKVETRFLATLARVGGWRMTDKGLVLTNPAGQGLLTFRQQTP
jgi:heat shock protein HslJ